MTTAGDQIMVIYTGMCTSLTCNVSCQRCEALSTTTRSSFRGWLSKARRCGSSFEGEVECDMRAAGGSMWHPMVILNDSGGSRACVCVELGRFNSSRLRMGYWAVKYS